MLFVNGIPLAVVECKRPDLEAASGEKAVAEAISQMVRNQGRGRDPAPLRLLAAAAGRQPATRRSTPPPARRSKFWSLWREEERACEAARPGS
ncbi:MAG: type I restriction endonuclease [Anaerolineae bacterium]